MSKWTGAILILTNLSLISACGEIRRPPPPAQDTDYRRSQIIDRLVPEDGGITPARQRAVIEAILTVMPRVDQRDLPENSNRVRQVLQQANLQELQRIESILPDVERKRQIRGAD